MEDRDRVGVDWNFLLSSAPKISLRILGSTFLGEGSVFQAGVISSSVEGLLSILARSFDLKVVQDTYLNAYSGFPVVYAPLRKKRIISEYSITYIPAGTTGAITTTPQVILKTEDIPEGTITVLAPRIVDDESILIELYREYSKIEELENRQVQVQGFTNEITLPTISQNIYSVKAKLKKGETLVLVSDLLSEKELQNAGIPFLKDIPVLGKLFGFTYDRNAKYQAIVFITYLDREKKKEKEIEFRRKPLGEYFKEEEKKPEKRKVLQIEPDEDLEDLF